MQERFFWLGSTARRSGCPSNFQFFHWPHSVRYLEESGVWDRIRNRVTAYALRRRPRDLRRRAPRPLVRERAATIDAIHGPRYQTLWEAQRRLAAPAVPHTLVFRFQLTIAQPKACA